MVSTHDERAGALRDVASGATVPDRPDRYAFYRGRMLIGTSRLEYSVQHGARAAGRFHTTPAFGSVAAVFNRYRVAVRNEDVRLLRDYWMALERLGLEVWDRGTRLQARVDLISTWAPGVHVIHVSSRDERLWTVLCRDGIEPPLTG